MMTNLLHGAHVANKLFSTIARLRLLLVMFVALTAHTVWGETTVNIAASDLEGMGSNQYAAGTKTVGLFTISADGCYGTTQFRITQNKTITISCSEDYAMTKIVFTTASGYSIAASNLSDQTWSAVNGQNSVSFKHTNTKGARITNIAITYSSVGQSYAITAQSNDIDYGTVSLSGTTITALPNDCYQVSSYEVTKGTADVSQNGNTFNVSPSSDCTIQINFEAKPVNIYIDNIHGNAQQEICDSHNTPTLLDKTPAITGSCEQQHWHFMGWVTEANKENLTDVNIVKANTSVTANGTIYYAVWAKGTTTGGGSTSKQYSFDITPSNFNSTSYAANNNEKTTTAKATDESNATLDVKWTSNQVMLQSSAMQWQKNTGYIYNSTDLGTINSITVTKSEGSFTTYYGTSKQPSSSTTVGNGYFQIKVGSATGKTSKVTITFTKTTQGAQTTTYSDYITSCTIEPTQLTTPTGLNVTNITSTSATLSWGEVANASSYTVFITDLDDEEITLTDIEEASVDVTDLSPETSYLWDVVAIGDGANYTDSEHSSQEDPNAEFTTPAAASPATITLSELGVTSTINTYSVGDQYTLPSTSSQSCDGKQLVGWSTVEVAETDTKPTSNYYELGAEVTLAATQTFYAVFAAGSGGGGEGWTAVTSTSDLEAGATYAISNAATEGTYLSTWDGGNNFDGSTSTICPLVLGGSEGAWTFQIADGDTYNNRFLTATNTTEKNYLKAVTTADAYSVFTISFDATNKNAVITCTGKASRNILRYNANDGSPIFACYTSGQSPVYLQKYATGGGGYTAYSTSCIPTYSITYEFAGGTGSHCSNTSVPQGNTYTICDEAPTKEGNTFLHWSDGAKTYNPSDVIEDVTADITLTAIWQINTYTVTWSNNGEEIEVLLYNHGVALVVPEAPESCDGVKEFVGWTTHSGYYHATTAPDDIFTTKTTPVTATATYYAVFATPPGTGGGGGGSETTIDDVLTRETTGVTSGSTNYAIWSGKTATSSAVYAGNSAGGNDAIQLRSNNSNSGIVTTTSGGKATRVEVDWESNTASDRTLDIYGRNVAYSAATDLYSTSTQGTKLGSIICGTSTELEITGDYEYIGLRSNSGAMYLTSVTITWSSAGGSSSHTDYTTTCQEVTGIAISGSYPTTFVQYDSFSFAGGIVTATFENGTTQDVTSLATFSGYNMDEVGVQTVTVTYMGQTAKYEITITESDRWRLTWNVSGKTNTGASPIYVEKGSAIGKLPVPEVPAACAGKTFMGWTESNIVPSDGKGIVYITEETVPSKNTTYYAVFATINNFSTQAAIEDIESGSKVVIVAVASMDASGGAGQAISSRTISITTQGVIGLSGDEVSIFDETINTPHSTCIWTLTKEGGGIVFEQGGKYIRAVNDGYRKLLLETTKDYWTLSPVTGKDKTYHMQSGNTSHYVEWFDHTDSKYDEGERYIGFVPYIEANDNGDFDMQFYVTANADGNADITDYTTGCEEYTITYYGFRGGYSTSTSSDGTVVLPVNSTHTIPNCEGLVINDHTNLGREFLNVWMTQPHGGHTFKPGDTFILTQDTTLYAQWKMETTSDVTTLPTDIEDLAGTDIYVYGGKTLNIQPGTTTINSLTLKGGLQADGSYKMPTVWVPEGATLVRNSNKINLDLIVNAKTYYPFAVPFATKNNENLEYLDPVLAAASTYGTHFAIKTYDGARRADVGEDKANNWVRVLRGETLQPGVGYIITALTYPTEDTATIRIPMTVSNTWFKNGEQAEVNTTVRNTIAVTAHAGAAATEHQRHAGWNFVANPYLTSFAGDNVDNDGGLAYINGELIIEGSYEYTDEEVPYVTIPAYDFAYYSQHKLSDVKLSPEWSFFVQVGTDGTMNFTTAGRQQAPAHLAARAAEQPIKMDVDITLSDDNHSDQTGLIICDRFSDAYEIGHDLEKMFGSAYNLSVYTLMADNTPLAFQALAIQNSMQVIPVGYRTPAQGEYTFALNEATSDIELLNEQYEQLILVDYETGALTNMLNNEYTFYSDRTQSNNRFALYAVLRQNTTTDLPNTIGNEEVKKVIYNDHFYILRDGKVFNGAGQIVK